MASPFDVALRAADRAQVAVFSDPVRITPRLKSPGKGHKPDGSRSVQTVRGVFTKAPSLEAPQGQRTGTQMAGTVMLSTAPTRIWLSAAQVEALGYAPAEADLVELTKCPSEPAYSINRVGPADDGGLILVLTPERPA